jgi:SAM-dependent methyltransferase
VERDDWNRKHGEAGPLFGVEPNRFLVAEVSDLPPGRALDVACGAGRNAVWLAERGWDVTAVDFSQVGLDKGARLAQERGVTVRWERADLREWTPPAGAFDLVVALYLHVDAQARRAIHAAAARGLAPGGVLLIVGHDATNIEHGHGGPQIPAILFEPGDLVEDVPELEIERAERVQRPVETADGTAVAIDALLRARRPTARG